MRRLAAGVTGPADKCLVEVDIEHHAAEIEQERIGGAGTEEGTGHLQRVRKRQRGSNGVAITVLTQLAGFKITACTAIRLGL